MKHKLQLLYLATLIGCSTFAQTENPWSTTSSRELNILTNIKNRTFPISAHFFKLDLKNMTDALMNASDIQKKEKNIIITLPNINGELESFKVWEFSNFAPELQAAFPSIRSYRGQGITDPTASLNISLAPNGIQTMIVRADKTAEFLEPYTTDGLYYALFNKTERNSNTAPFTCLTKDERNLASDISAYSKEIQNLSASNAQTLKKFRLALSCTGEYGQYFGGTVAGALAGMNATLTRVNGLYETEIAVHLDLIANNNAIIYLNPTTDPYSDSKTGAGNATWSTELQNNLTKTIGSDAYDIGHLFGGDGGGGNAGCIGCVCVNPPATVTATSQSKGMGFTSPADSKPEGDNFDVDYVSHEMGHQLGAAHTFSYTNESTGVQVEPGSGSTIMGYAGITSYDIQKHSDPYFSYVSLKQIQDNLASKTCAVNIAISNTPPVVDAGANYTIPAGTAFVLTGTGSDIDGDTILYDWEQIDGATSSTTGSNCLASATKTAGPNFRSFPPTAEPIRYFPKLYTILTSTGTTPTATPYEALTASGKNRTLNFALTARDNHIGGGQTNSGKMTVTVDGSKGPFYLTSFNNSGINLEPGSQQTITWNVGNTDQLYRADRVDIFLSVDNGMTYRPILTYTPNDGSEVVTLPADIIATNCRFMVKAFGNIFFAVNRSSFSIGAPVVTNCITPTNSTVTNIPTDTTHTNYGTSVINNPNTGFVTIINVSANITHPNFGELALALVSPKGTEIKLSSNYCLDPATPAKATSPFTYTDSGKVINCTGTDFSNILPQTPLYNLIGENAQGDWTLKYIDTVTGNTGTLNSWSLNLCYQDQQVVLGTKEFELNNLSLYPNPTNDIVNISLPDENNLPENLIVYNSVGQMVYNAKINSTTDLSFSTSRFANGVYFVKVNKNSASATLKFIKN